MKVDVSFFASLREERGRTHESIDCEQISVLDLYKSFGFGLPNSMVRFAVNNEFVADDTVLRDGDRVAFIPPVAGG